MIARLIALVFKLVFGFVALSLLMVVIYRFVPPPTTITMLTDANGATRDWTPLDRIPYDEMWADDRIWIPLMLGGLPFTGRFLFDGDAMLGYALHAGHVPGTPA